MFDIYYNYNSCFHLKDLNAIAAAIINIIEQEKGCQRLLRLPALDFDPEQLRDMKIQDRPHLLIVALFSGQEGWTIIKTYPAEFLCIRNTNSDRPRLSELAMQLGCDAFHYRVERDQYGILMEADCHGRIFVSGWNDIEGDYSNDEEYRFYQEKINEPGSCPEFCLLEVSESMQAAMLVNEDPEIKRKETEYHKLIIDNTLDPDAHFEAMIALEPEVLEGYSERIDYALAEVLDPSKSFWHQYDLLYSAYVKAEELEKKGVKLLYFQPPTNYNPKHIIRRYPSNDSSSEDESKF